MRTPGTAFAFVASNFFTLPPNTGGRATTAIEHARRASRRCRTSPCRHLRRACRAAGRGADQLEVLRLLERDCLRHWQRCRRVGELAVAERPAAGGVMDDRPRSARALSRHRRPMRRGGRDEHRARGRAGARAECSHDARTLLLPPVACMPNSRVAVLRVGRRMLDPDRLPVAPRALPRSASAARYRRPDPSRLRRR